MAAEIAMATEATGEVINNTAAAMPQGNVWYTLIYCAAVVAILYFLMVRPNKRRMAEYNKMLGALAVGDRVMAAGIYGTIKKINAETIEMEIAKGVVIEVNKHAIAGVEKK